MRLAPRPAALGALMCVLIWQAGAGCRPGQGPAAQGRDSPRSAPVRAPALFHDVASASGIDFRLGHPTLKGVNALETIGHGCAFLDYDRDGAPDVLLVASAGPRLYRNLGGGRFTDVTAATLPPPPQRAHFLGCSVADYDNDGRPDIFLTGYGVTALYHNEGPETRPNRRTGEQANRRLDAPLFARSPVRPFNANARTFRDVTTGSGLEGRGAFDWTTSVAWADVNGDGRLDPYVCRYVRFTPSDPQLCAFTGLDGSTVRMACGPTTYKPEFGSLYRNLGGGHFRDVTAEAGLADAHGNALGCMFCDFDNDGRPDLYIANDVKPGDLYLNLGGGRFRNIGVESGTAFGADGAVQSGMGVDWGDYDNDGRFDLLVANFAAQPKSLYHNDGRSFFTNVSYASGIGAASITMLAFSACFFDYDNDGWPDILFTNGHVQTEVEKVDSTTSYFQPTQLFHNLRNGKFDDVSAQAGPDVVRRIVGRGAAIGDFDSDGREDLLIVNEEGGPLLLHNEIRPTNHWLTLQCVEGSGLTPAVGARLTLTTGAGKRIAEVRAGGSYLSTNAPNVHFGLGSQTTADLDVRWPNGHVSRYRGLAADHAYRIERENARPLRLY